MSEGPSVGSRAPDFTLPSTGGEEVTLSAFRGRRPVLLAFFPAAFTGMCTAELCEFTEDYAQYERFGVAVLPISVDQLDSLKAFKAAERIGVELLSDTRREVSRAYDVLDEARFRSQRAYVLIDRDGVVRWRHVEEHGGFKRSTAELVSHLEALG